MRLVARWTWLPLLGLAACNDPSIDLGMAPPVTLVEQRVVVPLHGGVERRALGNAVESLGGVPPDGSVRAVVSVGNPRRAEAVREAVLGFGVSPALVTPAGGRGSDTVLLSRTKAHVQDCSSALVPSLDGGVSRSVTSLGVCIQANALAAMVADPADLAAPPRFEPADGARAAQAVLRWRGDGAAAPSGGQASAGGGEGASGGGGQAPGQAGGGAAGGGLSGDTAGAGGGALGGPATGGGAAASAE
jgi:hypothetical protein